MYKYLVILLWARLPPGAGQRSLGDELVPRRCLMRETDKAFCANGEWPRTRSCKRLEFVRCTLQYITCLGICGEMISRLFRCRTHQDAAGRLPDSAAGISADPGL